MSDPQSRRPEQAPKGRAPKGVDAYLTIEDVEISDDCMGTRWTVPDVDRLAKLLAIVAMGQASHAAEIIRKLLPAEPEIKDDTLKANAKDALVVQGDTQAKRRASRYHRDGLIFETISWAAAQHDGGSNAIIRDPHLQATTQGLDGLMIELDSRRTAVARATIFEDKCSVNPRQMFREQIMPTFLSYHSGGRATELLATATTLLAKAGLQGTKAIRAAERVLDVDHRVYRGCLATTPDDDSPERRHRLFDGYGELEGIDPGQRTGGVLVTGADLRVWFDNLATCAIACIDEF